MQTSSNTRLSTLWGHFVDPTVEQNFQSDELVKNIIFARWAILVVFFLELVMGLAEVMASLSAAQPLPQSHFFLALRATGLAITFLAWVLLRRVAYPNAFKLTAMTLLVLASIQFFCHQIYNPIQLPGLDFSRMVLFTLLIYLLMPIRTGPMFFFGLIFSVGIYLAQRHLDQSSSELLPLVPTLLDLLVLNAVGAWIHRNRQLGFRQSYLNRKSLTQKALQEAETVARQQEFIAVLAHEIRNPLGIIRAKCQLANLQQKHQLEIDAAINEDILSTVVRIQTFFDDLMSAEQAVTQQQGLNVTEFSARHWLNTALVARYWDSDRTVTISPRNEWARVRCDPSLLNLIVSNLCKNALKFSPADRPMTLAVRLRRSEVGIRVRDYGPGIAKEWHDVIFQKYIRQPHHEGVEGYGLGLFLAQSLALKMNGRITLQSILGRGSAFTIWLPRGAAP